MATIGSIHPPAAISTFQPILIAGPTAVGKSEVALLLAETIGGEIVSVDSMQVYRGLDLGTAKPSAIERQRVAHHLIDVVDLAEPFDAARFIQLAQAAVQAIQSRGRTPVFCGGTGLYFKAWLDGLGDAPPADIALRAQLEATPAAELLQELEQRDPVTFARIDRQNPRRVVRAVEVIRLTGRPFSEQRSEWGNPSSDIRPPALMFGLSRGGPDLHARINVRVDRMFAAGLVEETRRLLDQGLSQNRTAMQAIGYRQVVGFLQGERTLPETVELVKSKTRQFAKRQLTWFRKHAAAQWLELTPDESSEHIVRRLLETLPAREP